MMVVDSAPRVPLPVTCPYCRHDHQAICRRPASHDVLIECTSCGGSFAVRFAVEVKAKVLELEDEHDRVAEEQTEQLELQRKRRGGQ